MIFVECGMGLSVVVVIVVICVFYDYLVFFLFCEILLENV